MNRQGGKHGRGGIGVQRTEKSNAYFGKSLVRLACIRRRKRKFRNEKKQMNKGTARENDS